LAYFYRNTIRVGASQSDYVALALVLMAVKIVKTSRQLYVKLQAKNQRLLEQVLTALKEFEPLRYNKPSQ